MVVGCLSVSWGAWGGGAVEMLVSEEGRLGWGGEISP